MSNSRSKWTETAGLCLAQTMKQPEYSLVACDIDGTLIDDDGQVSGENRAAVAALKDRGIGFTLVTGRMDRMTRVYVSQLSVRLPIIACNGAVIRDCATDRVLSSTPISQADVHTLVGYLRRQRLDHLCYTADAVYYPADSRRIAHFHQYNRMQAQSGEKPIELLPLDDDALQKTGSDFVKLLAVLPDQSGIRSMRRLLQEKTGCTGAMSGSVTMDIMSAGVSKGGALRILADWLKMPLCRVVALGDQENDISMLSLAGLGIAMSNADPAVQAAADAVVENHDQSGVAQAIHRYVLR